MRDWLIAPASLSLMVLNLFVPAASGQVPGPTDPPILLIDFDGLPARGLNSSPLFVRDQFSGQGVRFNVGARFDYSAVFNYSVGSSAIPGFTHSGTNAVEVCWQNDD